MSSDGEQPGRSRLPSGTFDLSGTANCLDGLDVFYGASSNNLARVYARVTMAGAFHAPYAELSLSGFVRGPVCEFAKTIPTTTPLVSAGPGESLLAQAVVPDPCFWSPDVPSRYQVCVELRRGKEVLETSERELCLRNFGCRGKSFFLDGRRWVLRGVWNDECSVEDIPLWHDARTTLIVDDPSDELCREATRLGVLVVASVSTQPKASILSKLRRLAQFGAVPILLLRSAEISADELRVAAPNLLFALDIGWDSPILPDRSPSYFIFTGADLALVEMKTSEQFVELVGNSPHPVGAWRPIREAISLADARAACDLLQRDLAPFGDYAGYVV